MLNRHMLVSDYDGTFYLNEDGIRVNAKKVSEYRNSGGLFVMATGNNFKRFQEVVAYYNIQYDYLILDQGACVFDNSGNLLKACFMDSNVAIKIIEEIKIANKQYKLCNPYEESKTVGENEITKIGVNFDVLDEAFEFTNRLNKAYGNKIKAYTMIFKDVYIVEIISNQTDKCEAVKYIAEKEKIDKDNIFTIGDGYNDISMIQCFNGYCMKNSVKELLEKCDRKVSAVSELIENIL